MPQATAQEINDAIEEHLPDADDADALLDFDQVLTLYQHLVHARAQPHVCVNETYVRYVYAVHMYVCLCVFLMVYVCFVWYNTMSDAYSVF